MSKKQKTCSFPKCSRLCYCKDLCTAHYQQKRKGFSLIPIRENHGELPFATWKKRCSGILSMKSVKFPCGRASKFFLVNCSGNTIYGNSPACVGQRWIFLSTLYNRNYKIPPCRSCTQYKGGFVNKDGYIKIRTKTREKIFQHRYIMEQHLGRKLREDETIHHINGKRADNRLENLELRLAGNHPRGISRRDAVNWLRSTGAKVKL